MTESGDATQNVDEAVIPQEFWPSLDIKFVEGPNEGRFEEKISYPLVVNVANEDGKMINKTVNFDKITIVKDKSKKNVSYYFILEGVFKCSEGDDYYSVNVSLDSRDGSIICQSRVVSSAKSDLVARAIKTKMPEIFARMKMLYGEAFFTPDVLERLQDPKLRTAKIPIDVFRMALERNVPIVLKAFNAPEEKNIELNC